MNKVILMGRLTRDPEVRYSQGDVSTAVARYTLAVDRRFRRDGEATADFINCVAFGRQAEFAERYLRQGTKIAITGRIQTGSYTNRDGARVYTTDIVVEEQEFANAMNYEKTDKLLVIGSTDVEEPEEDSSTNDEDDSSDVATTIMYLIPSLILAVALILALIAYFMKKIKIKKWEKKKINDYDREHTLHRDVVRQEAEKQRQQNIDEVKQQIKEVEKEIERIEEINKQRLKDQRSAGTKGISRQTEKEFKAYAQRHTKLENSITALNEKIESMETPEYVLSLQRKIVVEKVKAEKEAKNAELKKQKEVKKSEKNSKE